jgi:hypothetical protein
MSKNQLPHYVSVQPFAYSGDVEFTPIVKFECPWLYGSCHFYPDCQCESFGEDHFEEHGVGHERVHHTECWMQGWFDADCHVYEGDDADDMNDTCLPATMNRAGQIVTSWEMDYVGWEFRA